MEICLLESDGVEPRLRSLENYVAAIYAEVRVDDESAWMGNFSHIWINLI